MSKVKVGLLPLYIALYDESAPSMRKRLTEYYAKVVKALEAEELDVIPSTFCCVKDEFAKAVAKFEAEGADVIVTLHMAYSPSLESIDALTSTKLPIVVMDTTETLIFNTKTDPEEIDYNHGIHGVMDMCSMLRRHGKAYTIAAGHADNSDIYARVADLCRGGAAAMALKGSKVGTIGGSFEGMGDFLVSAEELKSAFDVTIVEATREKMVEYGKQVTDADVDAEVALLRSRFNVSDKLEDSVFKTNIRACLTVRRWIEGEGLSAFTANFLSIGKNSAITSMPFIEACLGMERGIGYAGEGDVLTAAFCGAVLSRFPDTTFCEIFCPGWSNGELLLSHMGEVNYRIAAKPADIAPSGNNYTDADWPVKGTAAMKAGNAVFMNIYQNENGFSLFLSPVKMNYDARDNFTGFIRGFMKPDMPLPRFLEEISKAGATHHSVLVYDASVDALEFFAKVLGIPVVRV